MNENFQFKQQENEFDVKKEFFYYSYFWPYFLLSLIIAFIAASLYLRYTPKIYTTTAQVQFKKSASDPTAFLAENAGSLFDFDNVNLENEIALINSYRVLSQVVENLKLNYNVLSLGRIKGSLIYNGNIPFDLSYDPKSDGAMSEARLIVESGKVMVQFDEEIVELQKMAQRTIKGWNIKLNEESLLEDRVYQISYVSTSSAVKRIRQRLKAVSPARASEVVDISIEGENPALNSSVLNEIIKVLELDQVSEKQRISEVSVSFIDSRLNTLIDNIDTISKSTSQFRVRNFVFDPESQTSNTLSRIEESKQELISLGIQKEIATSILDKLSVSSLELLPLNVGIDDALLNASISEFNNTLIEREALLISVTEQSPVIIGLTNQLTRNKNNIVAGLTDYIDNINLSLNSLASIEKEARGIISGIPEKETKLTELMLNSSVLQELYVFLLQRKEEASLAYVSALPTLKVLSPALSSSVPVKPISMNLYVIAFTLGLILPFTILFGFRRLDTKINTRDDLADGLPGLAIVGEIPLEDDESQVDNPRGVISEATRVMRSNLSFLLPEERPFVIISTSSIKGEGKSFVSYNLAHSYAALGKKVILIGSDLRNPQLHNRLNISRSGLGLSNYLKNPSEVHLSDLICLMTDDPVHYFLSGPIPPNPSELLAQDSFGLLLKKLKGLYDVVVIDSAPLMLVSDTSPILPLCDLVVYVTRAQYTDKNVFTFIKDLQKNKNIPPFAMVLNGIIAGSQSSYKYGYKYRYSYFYKYNYGYGYGYEADKKET